MGGGRNREVAIMPVTVIKEGLNEAGLCRIKEDVADGFEYGDQIIGHFKTQRASWLFLKNPGFLDSMKEALAGVSEYYKTEWMVPKYSIFKDNKKFTTALPRIDKEGEGDPFLFIPKWSMQGDHTNKNFYIFRVDNEFNIEDSAPILFHVGSPLERV